MGSAGATHVTVLQVTVGPKRPAAQEVVFQPTGLRDLGGDPSLAVSRRGQSERRSVGPLIATLGKSEETVRESACSLPLGKGVSRLLSEHALCISLSAKKEGAHRERAAQTHEALHRTSQTRDT